MAGIRRRRFLSSAALALPGAIIVNPREGVRTNDLAPVMKVTRVEAFLLERPLTDRFWMSISPIGAGV